MKADLEAAMETESAADDGDAPEVPEEYRFSNPGEAVEKAKYLGVGEDRDLAGDEMIHSMGDGEDTVFMPAPTHDELLDRLREEGELAAGDVAIPMPSESVQLLYPERATAAAAARAMDLGDGSDPDADITHPHQFEGEQWFMPGADHGTFVDAVSGMDAGLAGLAPVARLNAYKAVGPIEFRGTREGDLDEAAIPVEDYEAHYFNAGATKSESSFPLVDGEGYLRRGNLDAAWDLRGQGDLGMPRDSAERLMLNLGLVFGAPDSEANPLPQEAYNERDDVGTPFAEDAAALAAGVPAAVADRITTTASVGALTRPDDPETGEVPRTAAALADTEGLMTDTDTTQKAELGSSLAEMMREEMSGHDKDDAEMMDDMAEMAGHSKSHMRSIARGDTGCPSMDALEAMSEVLDIGMDSVVEAAEMDGCDYSGLGGHTEEEEDMTTTQELKAEMTDKNDRIEELEAALADLRDENEQLQARAEAVTEVEEAYAAALEQHSPFSADTLAKKHDLTDLRDLLAEVDGASVADAAAAEAEPAVRSGSDGDATTSATANLAPDERDQVAELEAELETWEERDGRVADAEVERIEDELADLRGDK